MNLNLKGGISSGATATKFKVKFAEAKAVK